MFEILGLIGIVVSLFIVLVAYVSIYYVSIYEEYSSDEDRYSLNEKVASKERAQELWSTTAVLIALVATAILMFVTGLVWLKCIVTVSMIAVLVIISVYIYQALQSYLSCRKKKTLFSSDEIKNSLMSLIIFGVMFFCNICAIIGMFV